MAPKKKKNRRRGSKSKTQPGSSSGTVPSPPQDSPPVTTELHDEATTSQEPTSTAAPEGATPASPSVASVGPHSRSQGEEVVEERGVDEADPQMAALADSVDNMTVADEYGLGWLVRGIGTLGSTFPELMSMTRELEDLPDNQERQEVMADLTESLEAVGNIFRGYTSLLKRTVRILEQERSHRREGGGGASGGGGGSSTAGGGGSSTAGGGGGGSNTAGGGGGGSSTAGGGGESGGATST